MRSIGIMENMRAALVVCTAVLLAGCVMAPLPKVISACSLLDIASNESGDLAPAWYVNAGEILEACGYPNAKANAENAACHADKRSGYRIGEEC